MCFAVIQDKNSMAKKTVLDTVQTAIVYSWCIRWGYLQSPACPLVDGFLGRRAAKCFLQRGFAFSLPDPLHSPRRSSDKFSTLRERPGCTPETILSWAAENYMQETICCILPKASLGFEVRREQLRMPPPSTKTGGGRGAGGGARGEVSRQGSGWGRGGCPGYHPALPAPVLSQHWEKVATWWFVVLSDDILQCVTGLATTTVRDEAKDAWHERKKQFS